MKRRTDCSAICAAPGWSVSSSTCGGLYEFTAQRFYDSPKIRLGVVYSRSFRYSSLEAKERLQKPIQDKALQHGYTVKHFRRPNMFIDLRLSPRVRKHVRQIAEYRGYSAMFAFLVSLSRGNEYVQKVATESYMEATRDRWIEYVLNPSKHTD